MRDVSFKIVNQPRTADGGFGEVVCEKCETNSTVFLEIIIASYSMYQPQTTPTKIVLCKGCLIEGSSMISDGIIAQAL